MVFFCFLIILSDVLFKEWPKRWKLWIPFLAIIIFQIPALKNFILHRITLTAGGNTGPVTWNNPLLNMAFSLCENFFILLWPVRLTLYQEPNSISPLFLTGQVILLSLLICALPFIFIKARKIFFGIVLFIVFLAPTYSPVKTCCFVAERYLYFPVIILSILFAFFYDRYKYYSRVRKILLGAFIILFSAYILRTVLRNGDWTEPAVFWRKTLETSYHNPQAHVNMGGVYLQESNYKMAIEEFRKAIALNPNEVSAYHNLALAYANMGKFEDAIGTYKKSIEIDPRMPEAYFNMANLYRTIDKKEAIRLYKKAMDIQPLLIEAYVNLGLLYCELNAKEEAITTYKKALQINPRYAVIYNNLAVLYYRDRQLDLAVQYCDKALKIGYKVDPEFLKLLELYRK